MRKSSPMSAAKPERPAIGQLDTERMPVIKCRCATRGIIMTEEQALGKSPGLINRFVLRPACRALLLSGRRGGGGPGLVGIDQPIVVAVEAVEGVARAKELTTGNVAVLVAIHLLKPVGAERGR
jgi:hypothetical protein